MEMTFRQYIDNPMGKRNAVFSQRDLYRNLYTDKFDKIFLREAGKINYTMYTDSKKDRYYIHIKIPSETVKNFYYDAVIMFYTDDPAVNASSSLTDYKVKFFSNDPAFVFTYLHVFLTNDLFIEDLKSKASKLAVKNEAKIKNPYGIPGYSKILYFSYIFMKNKNLFSKSAFSGAKNYSKKELLSNVEDADSKISDRQRLGEEQKDQERREKEKEKKKTGGRTTLSPNQNKLGNIGVSKMISSVKSSSKTPSVKRTGIVKKSKRK